MSNRIALVLAGALVLAVAGLAAAAPDPAATATAAPKMKHATERTVTGMVEAWDAKTHTLTVTEFLRGPKGEEMEQLVKFQCDDSTQLRWLGKPGTAATWSDIAVDLEATVVAATGADGNLTAIKVSLVPPDLDEAHDQVPAGAVPVE
jgi:hypothetical protein